MKLVPFNRRNFVRRDDDFYSMYDVLDDFFSDTLTSRNLSRDTFKLDIEEKENTYLIEAELPGIDKDEVSIELDNDRLVISVERKEEKDIEEKNYVHRERRYSSMSRGVYLGDIDKGDIKAKLDNGVLSIEVPKKTEVEETKKIEIE